MVLYRPDCTIPIDPSCCDKFEPSPLITINPYRRAFNLFYRRLLWDLHPTAFRSRKKLEKLRNSQSGKAALILCNGPSLNTVNLNQLDSVFTFGLNKINLVFSRSRFRPSCIVAINPLVIQQNRSFYRETDIPLYLDSALHDPLFAQSGETTYLHCADFPDFAEDCSWSGYQGFTVTFVALQLAFHMGFDAVGLIGCDHYYGDVGAPNRTEKRVGSDEFHFDPNYFASGSEWQTPDLEMSEVFYRMALIHFQRVGRTLVNCTPASGLTVLPKVKLDDFLTGAYETQSEI